MEYAGCNSIEVIDKEFQLDYTNLEVEKNYQQRMVSIKEQER